MLRPSSSASATTDALPVTTVSLHPTCRAERAEAAGGIDAGARPKVDTSSHQSLLIFRMVDREAMCGPLRYAFGRGTKRGNRQSPGFTGLAAR
jgi:hypothetical protein